MAMNTDIESRSEAPPGPILRDPAYHDLCGFFAGFEEGKAWRPQRGDWVVMPPRQEPLLIVAVEEGGVQLTLAAADSGTTERRSNAECIWLPTLDQLHRLIRQQFGTTGFFSSTFNDTTYWYTGQMLGMAVTNMQPLAEGKSPEEAALKALLMRHQW